MRESRLRVAVVDDEETVRRALGRFFQAAGYEVETYGSGSEFLDAASESRPDCAVIDVHLTGLTAMDVLDRLAAAGITLPTVVVTGRQLPGVAERAIASGASVCLRKPLDGDTLLEAVTAAVHGAERGSHAKLP
jgi:FixJ family two-component response regulator